MTDSWTTVAALESAIRYGGSGLTDVPDLVVKVIDGELWRQFKSPKGQENHPTFEAFVAAPNPGGLGATVDMLKDLCHRRKDVLDRIDEALQEQKRPGARTDLVDNVHKVERPSGNSESAALRRLRKDRPDLHARVLAGELTAHAAAIEAGFRKRTTTIRTDDPESIAATLRRQLDPDVLTHVTKLLTEEA
jgi:hypothetical protein